MLKNTPTVQFLFSCYLVQKTLNTYSSANNIIKIYQYVFQVIPQLIFLWITRVTVSTAGKSDNCTVH